MNRPTVLAIVAALCLALLAYAVIHAEGVRAGLARTGSVRDFPAPSLTVRVLDVGQGDAAYVHNGESRVLIDGGPSVERMETLLDSLELNGTTFDAVVLTHAHLDHYAGLLALFESHRHIRVLAFYENMDPPPNPMLDVLRDSVRARVLRGELVYRDTDDACDDGLPTCTLVLHGGASLRLLRPAPEPGSANNRSVAVKLVGADSASFTMWLAGDAEHDEIAYFEHEGLAQHPGMHADVLKADHHGSCNGVSAHYLDLVRPAWVIASVGAHNDYGHVHEQAKAAFRAAGVPWYRTDQNGTITIRVPGTVGSGYRIISSRGSTDLNGPSDRESHQRACAGW